MFFGSFRTNCRQQASKPRFLCLGQRKREIYPELTFLPAPTYMEVLDHFPQHSVLAGEGQKGFNRTVGTLKGDNLSPRELQGRYSIALGRIGSADAADRRKPIYQRDSRITEQKAIEEAASALRALWKLRPNKA